MFDVMQANETVAVTQRVGGDRALTKDAKPKRQPTTCPVRMRVQHSEISGVKAEIGLTRNKTPLNELSDIELDELTHHLTNITGIADHELRTFLLESILRAMPANDGRREEYLNVALQSLNELRPADLTEAMLCSQAITLHAQGMGFMKRAGECASAVHEQFYMGTSMKLLALHQETIAALEKYRRRGQQHVQVEHVHVYQGGQAVVGTVCRGGG